MIVKFYKDNKGKEPFKYWLERLRDPVTIMRIKDRVDRISEYGVFGDCKQIDSEIYELRFHFGAGYRVYFTYLNEEEIALLFGGNKSSQERDIEKAQQFLQELK